MTDSTPSDATSPDRERRAEPNEDHGFSLESRLAAREARGLRRDRSPARDVCARTRFAADPKGEPPQFEGERQLVFAANNYLGLATDERVQRAAAAAAREVGTGAGASRLVTGDTGLHRALERDLAGTKGTDRALVFSSGYAANLGTISALSPDVIFSDELNHASIVDGCRFSDAETVVYEHADADALARAMAARDGAADECWLVVTDSVFSMDGDIAPLAAICDTAERHGAWVMVDEAHATGLYGNGGGLVQREGLSERVDVQLGTLSKALGSQGGYVAGDEALVELLANEARSFVYSTGLAPPAVGAAREALRIAREGEVRRALWSTVERLRDGLESMGYEVLGETQVLPVVVGERDDAVVLANELEERGVVAPAIRPPTVPDGTSRIRVAPMATHTDDDLERCLTAFEAAGTEVGVL
ncbi:aminotransferase class I/II-fold pyridoxal phosphate-dependent enzyme [Haloplanus sp. C73]|uniref:aminotransferase class I/II-fold pyridoxal phosphate-dependent enzyme n=1 Tax=Haloplanus sp. C73 TaxID=3421641 RepID=UPI003EBBE468